MIEDNDRNRTAFLAAAMGLGWPARDVRLDAIARRLGWPVDATVNFAWDGHRRYWETDGGLGDPPTVLEAP